MHRTSRSHSLLPRVVLFIHVLTGMQNDYFNLIQGSTTRVGIHKTSYANS